MNDLFGFHRSSGSGLNLKITKAKAKSKLAKNAPTVLLDLYEAAALRGDENLCHYCSSKLGLMINFDQRLCYDLNVLQP